MFRTKYAYIYYIVTRRVQIIIIAICSQFVLGVCVFVCAQFIAVPFTQLDICSRTRLAPSRSPLFCFTHFPRSIIADTATISRLFCIFFASF